MIKKTSYENLVRRHNLTNLKNEHDVIRTQYSKLREALYFVRFSIKKKYSQSKRNYLFRFRKKCKCLKVHLRVKGSAKSFGRR